MNVLQAIRDEALFRPFLGQHLRSWRNWFAALSCLYGLPVKAAYHEVVKACTGREATGMPNDGFRTALFLTGRRSGKSRMSAICGAYEACLGGHEPHLAPGELGVVACISPTRIQSRVVRNYLRAIFTTDMLKPEILDQDRDGFTLRNGIRLETLTGSFKTVRGHTLVAAIIDEVCYFGLDEEAKVKSDTELVRAVSPGLATTQNGRLIAISSPYAHKGWAFRTWKRHFGREGARTLVWVSPSRTMNPTLPQEVVDEAMQEDLQAAKSEYLGEFRDDVAEFLPRSLIEQLVIRDRRELLPHAGIRYVAFADLSGGRGDDAALAIGHRQERRVIIDKLCRYRPPFSPHTVIGQMCEELRRYGIGRVTGDAYSAEFCAEAFRANGIQYAKCELPKAALYLELLPRLCSQEIELLDDEALVNQLAGLERRTRSGGRDIIDHAQGGHDDLANVVAGVAEVVGKRRLIVGAF